MTADRYARQQLLEWWDQERLRKARVLVHWVTTPNYLSPGRKRLGVKCNGR